MNKLQKQRTSKGNDKLRLNCSLLYALLLKACQAWFLKQPGLINCLKVKQNLFTVSKKRGKQRT
jgi:hypothetical protein